MAPCTNCDRGLTVSTQPVLDDEQQERMKLRCIVLLPLLLHIVPVLLEHLTASSGGGDWAAESLLLRTEALQTAIEQIHLEAEALAEDACAPTRAPAMTQARVARDAAPGDSNLGNNERGGGTAQEGAPSELDGALGLRMLQPLDGEIMHFDQAHYRFEAFLPPAGDFLFIIALDGRPSRHFSRCSWSCPNWRGPPSAEAGGNMMKDLKEVKDGRCV